jgi:poly-gamma-glutamate synthesis protein (capsule biosynthesis protein)
MNVVFTGDVFLGGDLLNNSAKNVINIDAFNNANKRVVNLEQPISDNNNIEDKCTLFTGSYAIRQLQEMNINAVNLAHNHIQDKGLEGISETIKHLEKVGIGHFGAGKDIYEAKKPYKLDNEILIFGYCEYGKPYLKQIEVADEKKAGINPLRYENIIEDLNTLKSNQKAILYFHWGREHVFLPPYEDIKLAKKLLEDDRVLLIVGMHAHRPQGYIEHNGKRAYMCLGNFLFPNFFIKPPTQIYYPEKKLLHYDITRQYHSVHKITYKKWRWINRVSIMLKYNTTTKDIEHLLTMQDDDEVKVTKLNGFANTLMNLFIEILSFVYKMPPYIYIPLEKINTFVVYKIWKGQIYFFHLKQLGIMRFSKKFFSKILKKIKGKL